MKTPTLARLLFVLACLHIATNNQAQALEIIQQEEGVLVQEKGKDVLFFQQQVKSLDGQFPRANYVHPLHNLDGVVITEDFPEDHLHHRGIFWAWHEILIGGEKVGDAWDCHNIAWDVKKVKGRTNEEGAILKTRTFWLSKLAETDTEPAKIFKEKTTIKVHPSTTTYRVIDFIIQLKPLQKDMAIGGSTDSKGYSGFSPRVKLPQDIRFISEEGEVQAQTNGLEAGPWIDMLGSFDGKQISGFTMMMHPKYPNASQKWILRSARSMQNAAFPGNQAFSLPNKKWLELRYRVVIHRESMGEEVIAKLYQHFIKD